MRATAILEKGKIILLFFFWTYFSIIYLKIIVIFKSIVVLWFHKEETWGTLGKMVC